MANGITFTDANGRHNNLSQAPGGGRGYTITIDNWVHGQIVHFNTLGWTARINKNSDLQAEDIQLLVEMVEKMEKGERTR